MRTTRWIGISVLIGVAVLLADCFADSGKPSDSIVKDNLAR